MQPKREWHDIIKVLKGKKNHPNKNALLAKLSLRIEVQRKRFTERQKVKKFITKPSLQEMVKRFLYTKKNGAK